MKKLRDTVPAEQFADTGLHLTFDISTPLHSSIPRVSFWNEVKTGNTNEYCRST
jgi:hypothetical protein